MLAQGVEQSGSGIEFQFTQHTIYVESDLGRDRRLERGCLRRWGVPLRTRAYRTGGERCRGSGPNQQVAPGQLQRVCFFHRKDPAWARVTALLGVAAVPADASPAI